MQSQARTRLRQCLALLVGALILLSLAGIARTAAATSPAIPATASTTPKFAIVPVDTYHHHFFEMTLKPGQTGQFTAAVVNGGTIAAELRIFAANVTSPANGGFAAGDEQDRPTPPTSWLGFPATSFTLAPRTQQTFPFMITVPSNATPGQYVTALVARTAAALPVPGSENFKQIIRSAVEVEITVPGLVKSAITLGPPVFDTSRALATLDIPIHNTGNVGVKPDGTLSVTTTAGTIAITAPIAMGSVYAGLTTSIEVPLPQQFKPGAYVISLHLKDPATGAAASIVGVKATLAPPAQLPAKKAPVFAVSPVSVQAHGSPLQYAAVAATIVNTGPAIPTANVTLLVRRNGQKVEDYPLAQNQAFASGKTTISQRHIPANGWQPGTYTFQFIVAAVSNGASTVLATVTVLGSIVVS